MPKTRTIPVWIARNRDHNRDTYLFLEKPERTYHDSRYFKGDFHYWTLYLEPVSLDHHYGLKPGQCKAAKIVIAP